MFSNALGDEKVTLGTVIEAQGMTGPEESRGLLDD